MPAPLEGPLAMDAETFLSLADPRGQPTITVWMKTQSGATVSWTPIRSGFITGIAFHGTLGCLTFSASTTRWTELSGMTGSTTDLICAAPVAGSNTWNIMRFPIPALQKIYFNTVGGGGGCHFCVEYG